MSSNKLKIFIIDTSAILSGITINFNNEIMISTPGVSKELKIEKKDYQTFQYLIEKGLSICNPTNESINFIKNISIKTGDIDRLSDVDIEILSIALDLKKDTCKEVIILTDDYSIQNVANYLDIKFYSINQKGITKRFIWNRRCRGCGKYFKENIKICPICGSETKDVVKNKRNV
jgi:UPF0271 protein